MIYDTWTVFWRDWVVLKRRLTKFILARMVAPMLYLVAFGWGLGRSINVGSGSYLDFLVPGVLALNSMNISFNSITPVHAERIYHKSLEEYILAPIKPAAYVLGKVSAAVLRSLLSSAIILVLAYLFGARLSLSFGLLGVLILNAIIFAEVGFIAAMKISTYEEMSQVNTYILLPMSFLCGTFFTTQALPMVLRWFIELLPLTHTSTLLRSLAAGAGGDILSFGMLIFYAVAGFVLSRRTFPGA
ncbi:MAG: ABC transporter permease [Selenomonas sp.]|uniref:ABC transporter permease n=1 Tax=Selenomonas sp. TaxID=2053611 RepID=UPI0025F27E4D|nr:ABC transporter permease [Selenomonas sp.]MCR5757626.1 ABC transporter permease [Selenomonas sp.]